MGPAEILADERADERADDRVTPVRRLRLSPWLLGWLLAGIVLIAGYGASALRQDFLEPDNSMRLTEVRDFLGGQGWFDTVEKRLNPPAGTPMHWARWIDAGIAAPIVVLRPLVGQQNAEIAAGFIWPLGLLAVFMALIVKICGEIGARDGLAKETSFAGAIVAALAMPTLDKFGPGGFDHHNVELVCALTAMLGLIRAARSPRWGAIAGLALGLMMATAAEGVPIVAAATLVVGLLWLLRPEDYRRGLAWYGAGLAAASAIMFAILVPPTRWAQPVCDAMSTSFLGFGLAAGAVAGLLGGAMPKAMRQSLLVRLGASGALGAAAIAALWMLFPACAGGGYSGLGADMQSLWMVQISEARPLARLAADNQGLALGLAGSALAGLVAAGVYLKHRWRAAEGWIVLGFLLAGWGMLIWAIRGSYFATAFAIPFGAWAAVRARKAWQDRPSPFGVLGFAAAAATSAAAVWGSLGQLVEARIAPAAALASYTDHKASAAECLKAEAFLPLKDAPQGVMLNDFMLGTGVLQWTQHSVLAGPYHRDAGGTMAAINALRSAPAAARAIIGETSASYILICPALPETSFYAEHPANRAASEDTLSAQLAAGRPPQWLETVPLSGTPLKLYRIIR